MSMRVNEFEHIPGKNDTEYIKLLKESLERQKQITSKAIAKIKEISNYSEYPNNWIPCSERLPERNNYVLVTDNGETDIGRRFDGRWLDCYGDKLKDVTAWQPLPEPWKGEE